MTGCCELKRFTLLSWPPQERWNFIGRAQKCAKFDFHLEKSIKFNLPLLPPYQWVQSRLGIHLKTRKVCAMDRRGPRQNTAGKFWFFRAFHEFRWIDFISVLRLLSVNRFLSILRWIDYSTSRRFSRNRRFSKNRSKFFFQKMRDLCELNEKMVTCPWLLDHDQITKLIHRNRNQWRISELIQAKGLKNWLIDLIRPVATWLGRYNISFYFFLHLMLCIRISLIGSEWTCIVPDRPY